MSDLSTKISFVIFIFSLIGYSSEKEMGRFASGDKGIVISGKSDATAAGIEILEKGGNAVDAMTAAILALSVKHIGAFCIGGEVPVIIYDAKKEEVKVLSGQGEAPLDQKAIDWYYEHGIPGSNMKAAAVPGVIDLCITALKLYGTMSFKEVVSPTLEILSLGGPNWYIDTGDGDTVYTDRDWYSDLATTFQKLVNAEKNKIGTREEKLQAVSDRFYRADIADDLVDWYIEKGGFLRNRDLALHETEVEDPLTIKYRGYTICKCGPWTQGPFLLQSLRILEGFDLKEIDYNSADYIHVVTEAMKLAFADRDEYYGDPLFSDVPMDALLSDKYTELRRDLIDMNKASNEILPGNPNNNMLNLKKSPVKSSQSQGGTTICIAADRWGNVAVATPSGLGSNAGTGGKTGVTHGTRLVIFNTWKDHPNSIEPGKRPRTTLTPTMVLKNGKPILAISVAGGDMQDQCALQLLLYFIESGMLPKDAYSAPRFSTRHFTGSFGQGKPHLASLRVYEGLDQITINELRSRGHNLNISSSKYVGWPAILYIDQYSRMMYGAGGACDVVR
jgi:gamma-glutamyltranspeptidase/glutathione hydrolase